MIREAEGPDNRPQTVTGADALVVRKTDAQPRCNAIRVAQDQPRKDGTRDRSTSDRVIMHVVYGTDNR